MELAPLVCGGCGTRLHPDCSSQLRACPTLGCTESPTTARSEPIRLSRVIRVSIGALLLVAAIASLGRAPRPYLRFVAELDALVLGVPGLLLLTPALRMPIARRVLRGATILTGAVTVILFLPVPYWLVPFSGIDWIDVNWFSYRMKYWSLGDGEWVSTFESTHTIFAVVLGLYLVSLLPRREDAPVHPAVEKAT
ncbi:MAG: hypothetical protein ACAI25_06150 [Planctomycetota bacterium]